MTEHDPVPILVEKAKGGDREAFDEIVSLFRDRLEGSIRAQIRSSRRRTLDLDEVLQETLVRAFESIGRFEWRGEDSFFQWLWGIARNVRLKEAESLDRQENLKLVRPPPESSVSPSRAARREERFERFRKSLDSLSPDHREAIRLTRFEGLKVKDAARRMGRSEDAMKQIIRRALRKLKESFGDTESLHLPGRSIEEEGAGDAAR